MGVLLRIRSEASRIVGAKPDLVLTIGTPATKYAKEKIISAGIPLVFTAVAIPEAAGCGSLTQAGPGFTGATLHMNMQESLKKVKLAFPSIKIMGIVHSDDENAIAHVEEAQKYAASFGLTFITKEVGKKSKTDGEHLRSLQPKGRRPSAYRLIPIMVCGIMRHAGPSRCFPTGPSSRSSALPS